MIDHEDSDIKLIAARRPNPVPAEHVVRGHRALLEREMANSAGLVETLPSRRRRRALVGIGAAAAAAAVIAAVAGAALRDRPDPGTAVVAAPPPATAFVCGDDLGAAIGVPDAASGPTAGPAPGSTRPVAPGQRVVHWVTAAGSVEVRRPAGEPPVYDLSGPRNVGALGSYTTSRSRLGLALAKPGDDVRPGGSADADVVIDTAASPAPAAACAVLDITITSGGTAVRAGINLNGLGPVDLDALITAKQDVAVPPSGVRSCQPPAGMSVPKNRSGEGPAEPWGEPTPADALRRFLATPEAAGFATSGYSELRHPDGSITYAQPLQGGDGSVVLVSVTRSTGGWTVARWQATGC